ncbi:DUF4214 domain-containing protein [Cellulomonas sp.]|uniref:DUF4214 domain-containing protein n=1 Tax=Cellulomonas sp. TaxID=40001 RepID=UPI003BABE028
MATSTSYAWGGFFDSTATYAVSSSAATVRFTFPVSTDADPATATLGMSPSASPGDCITTGTPDLMHLEGWTLVLDPAEMAASATGRCVAANPGSAYQVWVHATGARDELTLHVIVQPDPSSTTTDVTLQPIHPSSAFQSFVTAPAAVGAGGTVRLTGTGGTFQTATSADVLDADGRALSTHYDAISLPFSTWSEIDVRLPANLPSEARSIQVHTSLWGGPFRTIRVPLVAPGSTPIDPVAAYVASVYSLLFQRSPDPTGLATWTTALRSGTPYSAVSDAITSSTEFRTRLVRSAYRQYLDRFPDEYGLAFWLSRMNTGMQIQQMEAGFLASDESYLRAGATREGWIASLYRAVLGRAPSPAEVGFWTGRLSGGATRYDVALGFTMSTEHLAAVVDGYYLAYLGRHGEGAGVAWWVDRLQRGARAEEIVAGILASQEFRDRATRT